jgi:predicted nucleotidyltransferase
VNCKKENVVAYNRLAENFDMSASTTMVTPQEIIKMTVERIVRQFDPIRIILFGSHARGEARPDSDVDLLVIMQNVSDKRQTTIEIRRALSGLPISKDIVVATPAEIAERGDVIGSVLRPALREGKIVYERA